MWWVYAIKSKVDGRIYVGMSENVNQRVNSHNAGYTRSTKGFRPWSLIYCEEVAQRIDARARELFLKGGSGKEFLKSLSTENGPVPACRQAGFNG